MRRGNKFRLIKPGSPHLNGKVERSHQTDLYEFCETTDILSPNMQLQVEEWRFYSNWHRPHGALSGRPPMDKVCELIERTPYWEDVYNNYDEQDQRIQNQNYYIELKLKKLKRSM